MSFEWFTLTWFMDNILWFIGLLIVGSLILFFFPILLGYDLLKDEKQDMNEDDE